MKVGIVAGEKSGDFLGAQLIQAIKHHHPDAQFMGLAGPLMQQAGAKSLDEMDKISIMGITGVLKALFTILSIRRNIRKTMLQWKPDVFIGIDVPDFNLGLEIKLKEAGIPTVHYVSPTVWAWRGERIHKIKRAVNLMLTLFPFERRFYQKHNVPVAYVGHPLAQTVSRWSDVSGLKNSLSIPESDRIVALLPGSRMSEVSRLAPIMLNAAAHFSADDANLRFIIPAANEKLHTYLAELIDEHHLNQQVLLLDGQSRELLACCYCAVLASGTAALEAGLFAKPMVVMYKVAKLEEWYAARTMAVSHFSMPNHLLSPPPVPELIQDTANDEHLKEHLGRLLHDPVYYQELQFQLEKILPMLNEDSAELAYRAIKELIDSHQTKV